MNQSQLIVLRDAINTEADATPHNLRFEGVPDSALIGAALRS